jgi:gamma-glutamylcyclotransferase (GGCT)/AIG2-like uncharacterized protein YtfP
MLMERDAQFWDSINGTPGVLECGGVAVPTGGRAAMDNLFAYGTLMCDDIMREVSGCRLSPVAATLKGYRRRSVKGEPYPALVPDEEGCVEGVVYRSVPEAAWDRLDQFEGEMYTRQFVQLELNDGATLPAAAYVVRPQFLDRLDPSDWDFAEFLRHGKARFQSHYQGYQSLRQAVEHAETAADLMKPLQ